VTDPVLPDERLAWLAAREYCTIRAKHPIIDARELVRPFWRSRMLGRIAGRHEDAEERMKLYAVAVDQLVERLTPADRQRLRAEQKLPPWFLPAVDEGYDRLAKARRR
jgi:hypothetical protein